MKPQLEGEVKCLDISPTFALKRFIEQELQTWSNDNPMGTHSQELFYQVFFYPVEGGEEYRQRLVGCSIRILDDHHFWLGTHVGRNVSAAFLNCIKKVRKICNINTPLLQTA